jgi:hypothetical protein
MLTPKKTMIVGLMTITTRTVTHNEVTLENLKQTGEMDGIVALETKDGEKMLLDITDDFGNTQAARIIKADDTLLAKLTAPPVAKTPKESQA